MKISNLRFKLERKKGKKEQIEVSIQEATQRHARAHKELVKNEKARVIIRQINLTTQSQLSDNISEITTLALNAVMKNPYELKLDFVERRNIIECDLYFERNGNQIKPFEGGGGIVDITAFALRVACWVMEKPKLANVLLLDEPFKLLKGEIENRKALEMVKQITEKLGIQIIMVSDERVSRIATIEATDLLIETSLKKGITKINLES